MEREITKLTSILSESVEFSALPIYYSYLGAIIDEDGLKNKDLHPKKLSIIRHNTYDYLPYEFYKPVSRVF
ncbi:MAG: hypothetical protein R2800_03335 [Flavipsychrobacter sp.]